MSNPFFTLITPTLQRESLVQCCTSISDQTCKSWQHVVMVDCAELNIPLLRSIEHPQRRIFKCPVPHINGGNTCRHNAWAKAVGKWCYFVDDDNFLADNRVLEDIAEVLAYVADQWAIFPIERLSGRFYTDPPRSCHVDTLNFILRKEIAQWPDTDAYGSDGILIDDLMARGIPYAAFPDFRPVGIIPKISKCE